MKVITQSNVTIIICVAAVMFFVLGGLSLVSHLYSLNGIKSKTVGDGQHGTARWATKKEIHQTYKQVPFHVADWRKGMNLPKEQGLVIGCEGKKGSVTALVDTGDVHCLMIGASGVGKTAFYLYPNLEYACASGMSFLVTDTKGDVYRNYGCVAKDCYGYNVAVIDLRNPTRSDGNNMLHLVNKYMDIYREDLDNITAKARAEKFAKILAKTIINSDGASTDHGQNAFFYDAAEGLLTSAILLTAEYLPQKSGQEKRHIISVFKLVQDLMAPSPKKDTSQFQVLMDRLPPEHKAKWFAGAALNAGDQAMASVLSTVLSCLNAFIDSELEQVLCFDTAIDAERFCNEKCAIFLVLPEENPTTYFLISLIIQQLYREILTIADENGGKLKNRVVFFCDELGTLPPIQSLEIMLSASRSRRLSIVPIIQSFGQLEKNYGKEGAEIIVDNCQLTLFGGFAPNSETAEVLSKSLGTRTVLSGSVSRSKNDPSQSLQMMERPLMTADELKALKRGNFIVTKTGFYPMRTVLRLFLEWGISFDKPYTIPERGNRRVYYADKNELEYAIYLKHKPPKDDPGDFEPEGVATSAKSGGMADTPQNSSKKKSRGQQPSAPLKTE